MKVIDKIARIHHLNYKILSTLSKGKDTYYIPGGKREFGESDIQTLVREIKEELTIDIDKSQAKLYGIFEAQTHGKDDGIVVKMTCYTAPYSGTIQASSEIASIAWLSYEDRLKSSPVDQFIFDDLCNKGVLK